MENSKNLIFILLIGALCTDLMFPYLIAPFYRGYRHTHMVMSVLGTQKNPMHLLYNLWLILLGILIIMGSIQLFSIMRKISPLLAWILLCILMCYAFGGCILSGIFPIGETKEMLTLSSKIHGFGSAIGFTLLTLAPLICAIYLFRIEQNVFAILSVLCFVFCILFFTFFIMADKPSFAHTIIAWEGLWQRLSLLCMYLPIGLLCLLIVKRF